MATTERASIWQAQRGQSDGRSPALGHDITTDVVIVGGGITGLSAARALQESGKRVVLLEAQTLGAGVTSRTTAHATCVLDTRYFELESKHGVETTRAVAEGSAAAMDQIERWSRSFESPFRRRPGYLYSEADEDELLLREREAMLRAGVRAELLTAAPLPFATAGALRVEGQAQFDAGAYIRGLGRAVRAGGGLVFEGTRVTAVEDGDACFVHTEAGPTVRARAVFVATHAPTNNRVYLQTKIAAYRSYVLACRGVSLHDGLFWDTADPYHYFSTFTVNGVDYLIAGGEDHKTGIPDADRHSSESLRSFVASHFAGALPPEYEWSAQVEEPVDGLPFIGKNSASKNVYVATGFSGNGTTYGTLAAMMVTDAITGRVNSWAHFFSATRFKLGPSIGTYLEENKDFPLHLLRDRLGPSEAASIDEIGRGEGKVVRFEGRRIAVHRDPSGELHAVSAICTHLGCVVHFNGSETSWDCPCHGSRFGVDGKVLDGPAVHALAQIRLGAQRKAGAG